MPSKRENRNKELEFDDLKDFADFEPVLTKEQMLKGEKNNDFGPHRRSALMLLTMNSQEMKERFQSDTDGEVMANLLDMLNDYSNHLTTLTEFTKSAETRLLAVGSALCSE